MMERIEIDLSEIPQDLMTKIQEDMTPWFASMAIKRERDVVPIGSGTFVSVNDEPCILTAAHVWIAIERAGGMLFSFGERPEGFSIDARTIDAKLIGDGGEHEWGPDLALLKLAAADAGYLTAKRSFLNLHRQAADNVKASAPSNTDLIAICGNVAEFAHSKRDGRMITLSMRGEFLFSLASEIHDQGDHDFIDVGADVSLEGIPEKFGGVSGGPLWQIGIGRCAKTGEFSWDGRRRLIGVAYWQSTPVNNRCIIRCHGPKSLYGVAGKEWRF